MTRLAQGIKLLQDDILPSSLRTDQVTFGAYFGGVTTTVFALAATLAVLMVTVGGVQYIVTDIPMAKSDAKGRIVSALTGLALLIVIALILETVNPNLLSINAFLGNFGTP